MSTIVVGKTLVHSNDGINPSVDGFSYDGTHAYASNGYSVPILVQNKDTLAIQVSCPAAGTPNGSFTIQGSLDVGTLESMGIPDAALANWATLSFWDEAGAMWASSKAVAGAQSYMATIPVVGSRWVRLAWTNTSGSVNLSAKIQIKADGGR